ncbi:hypothetical protein BV102_00097 [Haemophilus influenzae]|uniref:Uncharacterized protein n=2 Tax=Haemophilus influenzae TaxID=727 RepID=A0A2S9RNV9_HAEIF|nr:hypothetical protein BV021_01388 [Haemophilus influenzae]PRJ59189.1 hypothetical protein BV102_00097 [Haemophilus influenzae]PRJ86475.1 hypothetical protein BV154_01759 [Haemophilus influenzae]PRJ96217.1 hypothetical protein BV166_01901 [Haemophilus influenzae]
MPLSVATTPLDSVMSPIFISLTACLVDVLEDLPIAISPELLATALCPKAIPLFAPEATLARSPMLIPVAASVLALLPKVIE